ncbi:MAG: helix-turn-helix domain-containing protein [Lachnospiraceae bacterium]
MITKDVKMSLVDLSITQPRIHSGIQCLFVLRGTASVKVEEQTIHLSAEDLLVINSNQLYSVITDTSNIILMLEVEREYILDECGSMAEGVINCYCIGYSDESSDYYGLKRSLTRMIYIVIKKEQGYQLDFKVELLRFLHILYTSFRVEGETQDKPLINEKSKSISHVLTYINDNYYRQLNLEEVAKREYMSPPYFSKYFKRKTGYGFLEYLTSVRLKKAIQSLILTDDSIVKIALDHGFANSKSFNDAFKKKYQDTPGNYRKQYQNCSQQKQNDTDRIDINLEANIELKEFLRYVKKYDINFEQTKMNKKYYEVSFCQKQVKEIYPQENILNIGRVETAGYTNLFNQLETLRDNLGFQYVRFELEYHFIPANIHYSLILYNQFFRTIDRLKKVGMVPFIKISPDEKYIKGDPAQIEQEIQEKINTFIYCIKAIYNIADLSTWKIEIYVPRHFNDAVRKMFYDLIYKALKQQIPGIMVGYYALNNTEAEQKERFRLFLDYTDRKNCRPDFISFGAFPLDKKEKYLATQFFYPGLQTYYRDIIDTVKDVCQVCIAEVPPLYMSEWNTLMGDLDNESILYFRSAVIVDALLEVNTDIRGAGYWADSSVSKLYSGEPPMSSLALYMLDDVRRPIYPVLEIMKRLGSYIIHAGKNILVSRNNRDEYNILIWNPKYLNPSYSLDDSTTESLTMNFNIKLKNLEQGIYQIKKVTCNKEHSGAITQIVNAGYPDFTDMEVFDYIQFNIANGLNVYEEYIFSRAYILNTNLLYNGVTMYIIKKKEE